MNKNLDPEAFKITYKAFNTTAESTLSVRMVGWMKGWLDG